MTMTGEAKSRLAAAIRGLRTFLVGDPKEGGSEAARGALDEALEGTYRLSLDVEKAGLDEAARRRRERLVAWVAEQCRADAAESGKSGKGSKAGQLAHFAQFAQGPVSKAEAARHLHVAATQAAYTLLHRLVVLRRLEALKLRALPVLTGGFESRGYREFRELAPQLRGSGGALAGGGGALSGGALSNGLGRGLSGTGGRDETEGYAFLLDLVFADLATELPGVFGPAGVAELVPVPAAVLRRVVETLDDEALTSAWTDELVLGWVYQYWNDPAREALDDKLNRGGKVEGHELASKTQLFTERYMVDWLLQNSLGPTWLAICARHGWTADLNAVGPDGVSTLQRLEARRAEFRERRERGEVSLTELMPLHTELERRWAYYVPQPIPDDAVEKSVLDRRPTGGGDADTRGAPSGALADNTVPSSVRTLKILDPAVGSGHFLVVALELLLALYEEEARHRGLSLAAFVTGASEVPPASGLRDPRAANEVSGGSREGDPPDFTSGGGGAGDSPSEKEDDDGKRLAVERILSENLHGIDLDPRAIQIAAATLWIQGKALAPKAAPPRLNLVASDLRLGALRHDDPALVELRAEVERETGIPASLTDAVVGALKGADHLGSLLKIDRAVEEALDAHERALGLGVKFAPTQTSLFGESTPQQGQMVFDREEARASLTDRLETFLARHTRADDLGLRLRGEQLAAGVRLARMLGEGQYDLVVANPPYQGIKKIAFGKALKKAYPIGSTNLASCFLIRGLQLLRSGGRSAQVTPTAWMYSDQYADVRRGLLTTWRTVLVADLGSGAFDHIGGEVVTTALSILAHEPQDGWSVSAIRGDGHTPLEKNAACVCPFARFDVATDEIRKVSGWPIIYRWNRDDFDWYSRLPKIDDVCDSKYGTITGDDVRFLRLPWEPASTYVRAVRFTSENEVAHPLGVQACQTWHPYIKGAAGKRWCEPLESICRWQNGGIECKVRNDHHFGTFSRLIQNESWNFTRGAAFTSIGTDFGVRLHQYASIMGAKGRSIFSTKLFDIACSLNSQRIAGVASELNPSLDFNIGDAKRLPVLCLGGSRSVVLALEQSFSIHESHREPSVEFRTPGPSPWRHAQAWAQTAVDRPEGAPLPEYVEELDAEPASDHVSFALGVALGRFGANGEGILDPKTGRPVPVPTPTFLGEDDDTNANAKAAPPNELPSSDEGPNLLVHALPHGLLFLDRTLDDADLRDGLGHPAAKVLHEAWATYGPSHASQWTTRSSLRDFLALDFFDDIHKGMYERRPIHWPISSEKKTFVAWVNIHRMDARTLKVLLADHLLPRLTQIEGELADLRAVRDGTSAADSADPGGAKKAAKAAEKQLGKLLAAKDELETFVADVAQCAERGPLPTDPKCPPRERDAAYDPDLDDGVMINSSALWKLLEPQWKDPKKWWKELASAAPAPSDPATKSAKGKDYDWSHLAMRYFPTRVDAKCRRDPSLGVAHGCFWRYHPERAWAWELRLQDEIGTAEDGGPFRIREAPYRPGGRDVSDPGDETHRATFLRDHPDAAIAALEKETIRRMGRGAKRKRVDTFELHEPGLWSQHAATLYELELTLSERQGHPLTIHAPDEPEARAAYERAHPEAVTDRTHRLTALKPLELLGEEDDDESAENEGETDDGGDDDEATED